MSRDTGVCWGPRPPTVLFPVPCNLFPVTRPLLQAVPDGVVGQLIGFAVVFAFDVEDGELEGAG